MTQNNGENAAIKATIEQVSMHGSDAPAEIAFLMERFDDCQELVVTLVNHADIVNRVHTEMFAVTTAYRAARFILVNEHLVPEPTVDLLRAAAASYALALSDGTDTLPARREMMRLRRLINTCVQDVTDGPELVTTVYRCSVARALILQRQTVAETDLETAIALLDVNL